MPCADPQPRPTRSTHPAAVVAAVVGLIAAAWLDVVVLLTGHAPTAAWIAAGVGVLAAAAWHRSPR